MNNNQPTAAQLIEQVNILDLFNEVAEVKKSGSEYVCSCPIHQENTPSCYINEAKQSFHCKGCGAGGGVISFYMAYYAVDKGEAFKMLRQRLGVSSNEPLPDVPLRLSEKGEAAQTLRHASLIEEMYFFRECGLVVPIHYVNNGEAIVFLSAHGKPTDYIRESELRSGKLTDEGLATIGQYSQKICVCTDYIDSIYLSQRLGKNILFVFCGHPSRLLWAIDYVTNQYENPDIIAALPNIWDHTKYADFIGVPYIIAPLEGYWCEKSQRQEVL